MKISRKMIAGIITIIIVCYYFLNILENPSFKRRQKVAKHSSSTPHLNNSKYRNKSKKKKQRYQKLFADNYFKSSQPLKANVILAPRKVFNDYDLNLQ